MRRALVLAVLALALGCRRSEPAPPAEAAAPAPPAAAAAGQPAAEQPAAGQPAAMAVDPAAGGSSAEPAVTEPTPPQPSQAELGTPAAGTAPADPAPDEAEDETIYAWTDADGTTHFTTAGEIPPDRRRTSRAAGGNMIVVESAGLDFVAPPASPGAAPPVEALPPPHDGATPELDADGLPIPGTMKPTAHTRAAQQAGATGLDPAAVERQRAVDNRRMRCKERDGVTYCDGE